MAERFNGVEEGLPLIMKRNDILTTTSKLKGKPKPIWTR